MGRAYPRTWERLRIGTVPVPAYGADIYGVPSKADRLNALWTVNRAARFHGLLAPCFHGPLAPGRYITARKPKMAARRHETGGAISPWPCRFFIARWRAVGRGAQRRPRRKVAAEHRDGAEVGAGFVKRPRQPSCMQPLGWGQKSKQGFDCWSMRARAS